MPKTLRVFRVFVASPSDLDPEREALETAVAEINQTIGSTLGLRLDLIRWETAVYPSMGADPQALINRQIGDDFDIFIGLLWCRLGSPTPRAESGTVEEFERALARQREDPSVVEVMIYFKDAPLPPSKIDVEQLAKVQEFRERASREGLLATFSSTDEFLTAARIHLTRVLQGWDAREGIRASPRPQIGGELVPFREDDEPGFLDLIESSTENFSLATSASSRIAEITNDLGRAIVEATAALDGADYSTGEGIARAKRTFNTFADRLDHFAANLRSNLPTLRERFGAAISSLQSAVVLLPDFRGDPSEQLEGSAKMLAGLAGALGGTRLKIGSFRQTIETTPRVTTQFNRARRAAREALEELEAVLDELLRLVSEARKLQDALLLQYRRDS